MRGDRRPRGDRFDARLSVEEAHKHGTGCFRSTGGAFGEGRCYRVGGTDAGGVVVAAVMVRYETSSE